MPELLPLPADNHDRKAAHDPESRHPRNRTARPHPDGPETLLKSGYQVHNLACGEAKAGDSVEIVEVVRGGRSRPASLRVRASARFVEAARLANMRNGQGYARVALTDWLPEGVKWADVETIN